MNGQMQPQSQPRLQAQAQARQAQAQAQSQNQGQGPTQQSMKEFILRTLHAQQGFSGWQTSVRIEERATRSNQLYVSTKQTLHPRTYF